ncbi:MAG: hypothetical protein ACKPKO_17280, partial [Candidatus Fonsibacter sp.]
MDMVTPSDAPVATAFMRIDTEEVEPPELATRYGMDLEEPSMFDPECSFVLSPQVWSTVEKNLDSMSTDELDDIKRKDCAEEWRKMMETHHAHLVAEVVGDRYFEGKPMILSMADGGRVLANSLRSYGKNVQRPVYLQAYVCAGTAQIMERPIVDISAPTNASAWYGTCCAWRMSVPGLSQRHQIMCQRI